MKGVIKNLLPTVEKKEKIFIITCISVTLLLCSVICIFPIQSDDLFFYLAVARRFFRLGYFEKMDPFLYSIPNYEWHIWHEWLSYFVFYGIYKILGFYGVIIFKTIIILIIAFLMYFFAAHLKSPLFLVSLLIAVCIYSMSFRLIERSSLFSDFFSFLTLLIIINLRIKNYKYKFLLISLPVIFLSWVNLHPGFYMGIIICAISIFVDLFKYLHASKETKKYYYFFCISVIACIIALLINPLGFKGVVYPFSSVFDPTWDFYRKYNYEWMATFGRGYEQWFSVQMFLALSFLCGIFILIHIVQNITNLIKLDFFVILTFIFFTYLGFSAIRFVNTAALAYTTLIIYIYHILDLKISWKIKKIIYILSIGIIFAACLKVLIFGYKTPAGHRYVKFGIDPTVVPIKSAQFIDAIGGLKTNIFNQHEFGSYLCWHWDSKVKLFYHGFVTNLYFYKENYLAINESKENFYSIVNKYNIGAFYLLNYPANQHRGPLLYRILYSDPNWHLIYSDSLAVIFVKDIPQNKDIINKYSLNHLIHKN